MNIGYTVHKETMYNTLIAIVFAKSSMCLTKLDGMQSSENLPKCALGSFCNNCHSKRKH